MMYNFANCEQSIAYLTLALRAIDSAANTIGDIHGLDGEKFSDKLRREWEYLDIIRHNINSESAGAMAAIKEAMEKAKEAGENVEND